MIAYVSIGNSDDKLSQAGWAEFAAGVRIELEGDPFGELNEGDRNVTFHGEWYSLPSSRWQNACWCVEVPDAMATEIKAGLVELARLYGQDSIAWAEAPTTEFLGPPATAPERP